MSLHRYHSTQLGAGIYPLSRMQGAGLVRYHTPVLTQRGAGLAEELLKVAGPSIVTAMQNTVRDVKQGSSLSDTVSQGGMELTRNLKRKAPSMVLAAGKHGVKQQNKKAKRHVKDIFSL